jgi:hypothetical protein
VVPDRPNLEVVVVGSLLGGVVVSVLATGPKGRFFEPGQGDGFLTAINIRSTPSFGWEVKREFPCRKILRHVKDLLKSHENGWTKFLFPSPILLLAPEMTMPPDSTGGLPKRSGMDNRSVETAVRRRRSYPIITNLLVVGKFSTLRWARRVELRRKYKQCT